MTGVLPQVDPGLLYRFRDGDEIAFAEIYRLCAPALYHRIMRLLKDIDTTEEILQDVFLKLWEHRERIDPELGFRTYLYRIADNLAIDVFRKISRDRSLQKELWARSVGFCLQKEEAFGITDHYQLVAEAIDTLPPKRKQILVFCKLEEKSYQEVAELMGISVSTVSNQLVRAVKDIKSYVSRMAGKQFSTIVLLISYYLTCILLLKNFH